MALTKIRGNTQILDGSVTDAQLAAGIALSKIQGNELLVQSNGSVGFTSPVSGVTPTDAAHLVTKAYVDASAQGLDVKASVRVVALADIVLTGLQTIDGVGLIDGNRVLLTGQVPAVENGIYVVRADAWTRAADATTNEDVTPGLFTFVEEGSTGAGTGWVLTSTGPTTLGTTPLPFAQFSSAGVIQAGDGIAKVGNVISVVSGNGGIVVTPDAIALTLDGTTLAVGPAGLKLADAAVGQILVGDAGGVLRPVAVSGDISIDAAGVVTIAPGAVGPETIADGSLALAKLVDGTAGQVIVVAADGTPTYTNLSGDVTINAAGVTMIGANAVSTAEIADGSVTLAKTASLAPGQIVIGTTGGTNTPVTLSGDVTISEAGVVSINRATVVRVADMITRETPAGLFNGVNTTFVLAGAARADTESVYVNGILQDAGAGNDYTIAGDTITMLYTLSSGDKLRVSYFK